MINELNIAHKRIEDPFTTEDLEDLITEYKGKGATHVRAETYAINFYRFLTDEEIKDSEIAEIQEEIDELQRQIDNLESDISDINASK